jgi:hypothetical protein
MKTIYSHAAPYIRNRLVYTVHAANNASTQRERLRQFGIAYGYAQALSIMADSSDQTPVDGVADVESLPSGALQRTREWLKLDADKVLGKMTEVELPVRRLPVHRHRGGGRRARRLHDQQPGGRPGPRTRQAAGGEGLMADYPECEKLAAVSTEFHAVEDFLSWANEQGYWLGQERCPHGYLQADMVNCSESDYCRRGEQQTRLWGAAGSLQDQLARYHEIDVNKVEAERRAMLAAHSELTP